MRETLFIFNPRSSKEQAKGQLMEIPDILTRAGYELRVHVTQKQEDAMDAATRPGRKMDAVACSSGDDALDETISGIIKLRKIPLLDCTLTGSINDFATSLGVPKRMPLAAWDIMERASFAVDARIFCEDRNFMYVTVFGIFTKVSYLTSQDRKNLLGHQTYILEDAKSLAGLKPYHMKMGWDEQVLEEDSVFGMATNTINVGGFKGLVNQSVALNNGSFEVPLIRMPKTPVDLSNITPYMFLRGELSECVHKFKTSSIRLTPEWEADWVLDSEYDGSRIEVTIGNIKESIQILLRNHLEEESGWKQIE